MIIKGVKVFQNNACQEYSDLDIMQMMGRAVRAGLIVRHIVLRLLAMHRLGPTPVRCVRLLYLHN